MQDKIQSFWDITKKELDSCRAELRNKDREIEDLQDRHQVEIKVRCCNTNLPMPSTAPRFLPPHADDAQTSLAWHKSAHIQQSATVTHAHHPFKDDTVFPCSVVHESVVSTHCKICALAFAGVQAKG